MKNTLVVALLAVALSGCSTVTEWFSDEEELEIRYLAPIQSSFEPSTLWSKQVGGGVDNYFSRLQPAVAYGKVFAASRDGEVLAFDKNSGKQIWRKNFANSANKDFMRSMLGYSQHSVSAKIAGGMTAAYETVFFGTEDGFVYALKEDSGETLWQATVAGEVLSAPAVDAGVVVINTGAGTLIGLNANTGEQLWASESDVPPLSLRGISAPTASSGGALVGTPAGKLQVNVLENGIVAWEATIGSPTGATELERIVDVDAQPVVLGGNVYVISYNGTLASVEIRTGRVVWTREYASYVNLSVAGNRLFVSDNGGTLYAIDRRNGVEMWSNGTLRRRGLSSATPSGDYVVAGDKFGYLHWFTQEEGKLVARMTVGDDDEDEGIFAAPVSDGDILYVQTREGKLSAISR